MGETDIQERRELKEAFQAHERRERLNNTKVGCVLVITLMPAGSLLDLFVYGNMMGGAYVTLFFKARILCSLVATLILGLLFTDWGKKAAPWLGVIVPLLPAVFIAWMISQLEGFKSPYYAGLNLVLLAVGAVLRWTTLESIIAVTLVLIMYIIAGLVNDTRADVGTLFNNFYFIALMDVIVVVGTFFQYRQRRREFSLRFQLDQKKQELEDSNEKLVELDRIKSRFFGNISHELRTPLTLLLSPLETILSRFKHQFDANTRNLLVTMHGNGLRLLKLINDLLDLVRLESGVIQIRREPVNVGDFISGLIKSAQQMADDKQIRLETRIGEEVGYVMLDRDRLEKVILNLLFNSLKFTPREGRVTIQAEKSGESLIIAVEDTGIGIPKKQLPHVFDRFWQADGSSKRKNVGVGIGLSLVKELVEAHDGTVTVDSTEGQGTKFTIQLPYLKGDPKAKPDETVLEAPLAESHSPKSVESPAAPVNGEAEGTVSNQEWLSDLYRRAELFPSRQSSLQEESPPLPTQRDSAQAKPRLLVADDEYGMREFIKSQLQEAFQIIEAEDGQQAIDKAGQYLPDVILLDMMMPEKDGLQACQEIRTFPATSTIPVIMLTARADEEIKLAALEAGVSDFLSKPFSTTELQVRIQNLVDSHGYQRQLAQKNQDLESTIDQLKEAESQLVQTEKLASLGRLSAGIIHEINNPLNFATTGLFTLKKIGKDIPADLREDYQEILSDVEEGITRVKTIVSDLRSFSHHENESMDVVPVRDVVVTTLRFISEDARGKVHIEEDIADGLCFRVNKNKMVQVMINLTQNALDAIQEKDFGDEQPCIEIKGREENNRCLIIVRDNGPGISPEAEDKIFDPFFTTKDVGAGMGLGLSICYRIIESFSGQVTVQSEPGQGCEFQLSFPAVLLEKELQPEFHNQHSIS